MAAQQATVIDLAEVRRRREAKKAPQTTMQAPAMQPMLVWVPMWMMVPLWSLMPAPVQAMTAR